MQKIIRVFVIIFQISLPLITFVLCRRLSIGRGYDFETVNPYVIIINVFLWTTIYFLFLGLFKKNYLATFFYLLFFLLFTIANRYKIKFLNLPVRINDLTWGRQLLGFVPAVVVHTNMAKELIASFSALIASFFVLKHFLKLQIKNINIRLFFVFIALIILTLPYNQTKIYDQILNKTNIVFHTWDAAENCRNNGMLLCFINDGKYLKFPEPEGYTETKINQIYSKITLANLATESAKKDLLLSKEVPEQSEGGGFSKPNIIILMSESFWDATNLSGVKYSSDPIKNVREDVKSNLISPAFGGETSNVEFELLTGLSNYFFTINSYPYTQYINKSLPSLFSIFKENDYYTSAIHPYSPWFYNRDNVYRYFGVDKFINLENIGQTENAGPFVSDKSFTEKVINQINSNDKPQLIFALSIQNHAPFEANRFPTHPITFQSSLNNDDKNMLQSYIDGINLSDQSYKILKTELSKTKKPTILVFFGDHLPSLGLDFDLYKKLGFDYKDETKIHSTPLSLWSNFETDLNLPSSISPSFLSLEILKMANIKPKYQFYYLDSIKNKSVILHQKLPTTQFDQDDLINYNLIQYDLIFGKQYGL